MLRISGGELDIDAMLQSFTLRPNNVWRKGDPDHGRRRASASSGASFVASDAEMSEFDTQVRQCLEFLDQHGAAVHQLATYPGVDSAYLDFAIEQRDVVVQRDQLPAQLVTSAARCGLGIAVSHYPVSFGDAEQ